MKWISVKERLPPEGEIVLVCDNSGYPIDAEVDMGFLENGEWKEEEYIEIGVTHWMPFPEPPKEEE